MPISDLATSNLAYLKSIHNYTILSYQSPYKLIRCRDLLNTYYTYTSYAPINHHRCCLRCCLVFHLHANSIIYTKANNIIIRQQYKKYPEAIASGYFNQATYRKAYLFIVTSNSSLLRVFSICFVIVSIASTEVISARNRRNIHVFCKTSLLNSKSSRRVPEATTSTAG